MSILGNGAQQTVHIPIKPVKHTAKNMVNFFVHFPANIFPVWFAMHHILPSITDNVQ